MKYTNSILQSDEIILQRAEFHWIIYYTHPWVRYSLFCFFIYDLIKYNYITNMHSWEPILFSLSTVLMILGLIQVVIFMYSTEMVSTNRRVIKKMGLIMRDTQELSLNTIESVEIHQTLLGRILGYANIEVNGVGGRYKIYFDYIKNPIEFRNNIRF